jgi:peptidoglycan/xylan/chitin deacetylase (PgdA/CDA1 family)
VTWSKTNQDNFLVDDTLPFAFAAQLDWLAAHGYATILPRDLAAHWDTGKVLPPRPIILTFDDGFENWRSFVLPQLRKHHMVAEFYVVIENVGRSISWADVNTLARAGMGIGAHDVQHVQLTGGGVAPYPPAVMRYQVTEAKRRLEAETGVKVDSMAYVGGGFDATLMAIVQQAGYSTARSIERGVVQAQAIRFHLHVSRIGWKDDVTDLYNARLAPGLPTFAKRVSGANPG